MTDHTIRFVAAVMHADLADDPDGHKRDELVRLGQLAKVEHDTTRAELLDARRERDEARGELATWVDGGMAMMLRGRADALRAERYSAIAKLTRLREAAQAEVDHWTELSTVVGAYDDATGASVGGSLCSQCQACAGCGVPGDALSIEHDDDCTAGALRAALRETGET